MLLYFVASDHYLCTMSMHLYIQSVNKLKNDCLETYQPLASGYHVVRRSEPMWMELSTDFVIE